MYLFFSLVDIGDGLPEIWVINISKIFLDWVVEPHIFNQSQIFASMIKNPKVIPYVRYN